MAPGTNPSQILRDDCIFTTIFKNVYANSYSEIWSGARDYAFWGDLFKVPKPGLYPRPIQSQPVGIDPRHRAFWSSPCHSSVQSCLGTTILHWTDFHGESNSFSSSKDLIAQPRTGALNPGYNLKASEEHFKVPAPWFHHFPPPQRFYFNCSWGKLRHG